MKGAKTMNQEKIGKFIATCRKEQKITQQELAERLGVSDRTIGNWENGRNMPDLSLFKPLCDELDITLNDLMSGEKVKEKEYQEKFEENIVNTIDYSTKKITKYNQVISLILIIFGLFVSISAIMIFPSESSWGSVYSVFGIIIFMIGIARILNIMKWYKRLFLMIAIFTFSMGILLFTDYLNVKFNHEAPMFRIITKYIGNVIYYDTLFYDVYRCNFDTDHEYWVVEKNSKKTDMDLINYCKE